MTVVEHTTEHEELVAGAALGVLDSDDQRTFEKNLTVCSECARELTEFQEVVGHLALLADPVEPPAHLKQRILSQVLEESRVGGTRPGTSSTLEELGEVKQRGTERRTRRLLAGVASALLLVVGAGWVGTTVQGAREEQSEVLADIALSPETRRVVLEDPLTGETQATALLKQGVVVVSARGLPVNDPSRTYVLWAEDSDGRLEAVAGFHVGHDQEGPVLEAEISGPVRALAISLEEGREVPEEPSYAMARGEVEDL